MREVRKNAEDFKNEYQNIRKEQKQEVERMEEQMERYREQLHTRAADIESMITDPLKSRIQELQRDKEKWQKQVLQLQKQQTELADRFISLQQDAKGQVEEAFQENVAMQAKLSTSRSELATERQLRHASENAGAYGNNELAALTVKVRQLEIERNEILELSRNTKAELVTVKNALEMSMSEQNRAEEELRLVVSEREHISSQHDAFLHKCKQEREEMYQLREQYAMVLQKNHSLREANSEKDALITDLEAQAKKMVVLHFTTSKRVFESVFTSLTFCLLVNFLVVEKTDDDRRARRGEGSHDRGAQPKRRPRTFLLQIHIETHDFTR